MQNSFYIAWVSVVLVSATISSRLMTKEVSVEYQAPSDHAAMQTDSLLKGEWYLVPVLASDTATGKYPTINFSTAKGTFTGNTGCNRMSGSFKRTDSSLVFNENIMLTKIMCTGYNEAAFIKTLLSTNRYKRDDSILILMFNQTELSRWTRKPYRAPMGKKA